jgi:hypothetical protein
MCPFHDKRLAMGCIYTGRHARARDNQGGIRARGAIGRKRRRLARAKRAGGGGAPSLSLSLSLSAPPPLLSQSLNSVVLDVMYRTHGNAWYPLFSTTRR